MTLAIWPIDLPKPSRSGYGAQTQDMRMRKAANGPPGYRGRFSSAARLVSLSMTVTRSQKAIFEKFFDHETRHGTLPFTMPDPVTDGWQLLDASGLPVVNGGGTPILLAAQWLCLFGDENPQETITGVRFNIAFNVAVMP